MTIKRKNLTCPRCNEREKEDGFPYCTPCFNEYMREYYATHRSANGTIREYRSDGICPRCGESPAIKNAGYCKKCMALNAKEYYHRLKRRAYEILGDKCIRCGFDDLRALQIDHIRAVAHGAKRLQGHYLFRQIITGDIGNYQLLCANCNWIKRHENKEHKSMRDL